jgi:hypothetical protein
MIGFTGKMYICHMRMHNSENALFDSCAAGPFVCTASVRWTMSTPHVDGPMTVTMQ